MHDMPDENDERPSLEQRLLASVQPEHMPTPKIRLQVFGIDLLVGQAGTSRHCIGVVAVCEGMVYHKLIPKGLIHLAAPNLPSEYANQLEWMWQACHESLTHQSLISPFPSSLIYNKPQLMQYTSPEGALRFLYDQWVSHFREDAKPVHQGGTRISGPELVNAVVEALRTHNPALASAARVMVHDQDTTVATDSGIVAVSSARCAPDDLLFNVLGAMTSIGLGRLPGQRAAILLLLDDPSITPTAEQAADIERTRSQMARNGIETLLAVTPEHAATTLSDWLTAAPTA